MLAASTAVLVTACSTSAPTSTPDPEGAESPKAGAPGPSGDPALAWGPLESEMEEARALVADWTPEQLAGQVIVGRYFGTDPAEAGRLVRQLHLAGVSVTGENVLDADQVRATTRAVTRAVAASGRDFPAVIGVDQEGGVVSHLDGVATEFPSFQTAGDALEVSGRAGARAVQAAARTTSLELRSLGFTWAFAPVADVTVGSADVTIGSRSPSSDPQVAARTVTAAVTGYVEAGVVSTTKHFPGHGAAGEDSHETLPQLDASTAELRAQDLVPFEAAVRAGAPAIMIGHLDVRALAPGVPSSMAPEIYDWLREDTGFEGVTITDSLGMGAVAGRERPAVTALAAGADLLLMPADTRRTHATVVDAIRSGDVSRERAEEAAARVVALQRWQQRVATDTPLPADPSALAAEAAQALVDAAAGR
ncbi:hypothetical protein GCM10027026_31800 [Myroides odoratimimus subsp. xuanwuensis]